MVVLLSELNLKMAKVPFARLVYFLVFHKRLEFVLSRFSINSHLIAKECDLKRAECMMINRIAKSLIVDEGGS